MPYVSNMNKKKTWLARVDKIYGSNIFTIYHMMNGGKGDTKLLYERRDPTKVIKRNVHDRSIYSSSVDDLTIDFCFFENYVIGWEPKYTMLTFVVNFGFQFHYFHHYNLNVNKKI